MSGEGPGTTDRLATARAVADAVMYEGYALFPYRASATKNQYRWQWGVVIPAGQVDLGASEPATVTCELLLRAPRDATVLATARFLRLSHRQVIDVSGSPVESLEVAGEPHVTWDEGRERHIDVTATVDELVTGRREVAFRLDGDHHVKTLEGGARVEWTTHAIDGVVSLDATPVADGVVKLTARVRNTTGWSRSRAHRDEILRRSLIGAHLIIAVPDGHLGSAIDPPDWAAQHATRCHNRHLYPVLVGDAEVGDDDVALAAPIILYDYPTVAPESPGPSFDATEIDGLLAATVMGLTDEEKREARATDRRVAELIDRLDGLAPEEMAGLRGAIREVGPPRRPEPSLDPAPEAGVSDEVAELLGVGQAPPRSVTRGGTKIRVGSRVRLVPQRRADAHDLFVAGRTAVVERLVQTVDGPTFAAVTIEDDPAADLHRWYGRFHYFDLDEVEPIPDPNP